MAGVASSESRVSNQTVYFTGEINQAANLKFFEAVKGKTVNRLVITSAGGEVAAAIALGQWVFEQKLDVEIPGYCFSSCANYVFPAGRKKIIHKGAVVAWHGNYRHLKMTGLWIDDVALRVKKYGEDRNVAEQFVLKQVDKLVDLETAYFRLIGVDESLCWIGKMPPYNAANYYFLSAQDMARFGVDRVEVPDGYKNTDVSGFPESVVFIRLQEKS